MKKALVIFTATSMFATGISLASNISFGHKMAAFLSDSFEFVGPMSGLVKALVKHTDAPKARVIPNFQDGMSSPSQSGNQGEASELSKPVRGALSLNAPSDAFVGQSQQANARRSGSVGYTDITQHAMSGEASRAEGGAIARAITENGNNTVLASLGKSLQGKFQDAAVNGSKQDVWATLMNKSDLAPTKLALNLERSNKQQEVGMRITESITAQGLAQNGPGSPGSDSLSTASQITPVTLAQVTPPSSSSAKVPLPGGLPLVIIGMFAAGALRFIKSKSKNYV
jgi:hypothetical protein